MRVRRVILDRLEWSVTPGGRFVSGNASGNAGRSDAVQMCLRRRHSVPSSPHVELATVAGQGA